MRRLCSILTWRLAAPLRRILRVGGAPKAWTHLDLMANALHHLHRRGFRPGVVFDVGAAQGYWSQAAGAVFPEAVFYLFEPLQESEPPLRALSRRDSRFHYLLVALGRERGTRGLSVAADPNASSLLPFPGQDAASRRTVPVETVDYLVATGRTGQPDLVKLDVQGFELEVLGGAHALFGTGCVFIVEVSLFEFMPGCPLIHEVVAYFGERGYRLFDVAGLLRRPFQDDLGQMDLVFVPRDSALMAETRWS